MLKEIKKLASKVNGVNFNITCTCDIDMLGDGWIEFLTDMKIDTGMFEKAISIFTFEKDVDVPNRLVILIVVDDEVGKRILTYYWGGGETEKPEELYSGVSYEEGCRILLISASMIIGIIKSV